jgi:hypothetical protein
MRLSADADMPVRRRRATKKVLVAAIVLHYRFTMDLPDSNPGSPRPPTTDEV